MKTKFDGWTSRFSIGLIFSLALAANSSWGKPLPPDKLAFVGLWKTPTGYGLDFNTNGTVKITEDYNWQEIPGWFTVFQRDWNEDNVPVAGGTNYSATVWDVEFQNDDFLLIYGPGANRRYKINIYPYTETNGTKMVLNGMEFTRLPREGLSTPVPPSDPLDLPIANKALAARIAGINQMTDQNALARLACTDKESTVRKAALRKISDPAAFGKAACDARESDVRWLAINRVTDSVVLMKVACQNNGWDGYLNAAAVERLNDQAALFQLARDATNWPGLWTVRNHATSKLMDQEALATVACEEHEPQICRTVVRGLTNQDLLVKVILHGGDFWAVRKQAFNKLDPAHLTALAAQTKDLAQVLAVKIKSGELNWDQVFSPEGLNTNGPGNIVGAAALVNRPKPDTNAVLAICHRLATQDPGTRWPELVDLLNRFGDRALAEDYVNSGEHELIFFGAKWADNHGYHQAGGLHPGSTRVRLVANDERR
ncbi:MAG: hypothetical protein ACLQAH_10430 [Limisphaerales bacterium]